MRLLFSGVISTALILANSITLAAASSHSTGQAVKTIRGMANAKHVTSPSDGNFYIQAGTFKYAKNAHHYQQHLIDTYHHTVKVTSKGRYHIVVMGPIHSAAEVRALNHSGFKAVVVERTEVVQPVFEPVLSPIPLRDGGDNVVVIAPVMAQNHFEIIGAAGVANLKTGNGFLGVTTSETDRLVQTNRGDWDTFSGQLGVGYVYYFPGAQRYSESTQWFPAIEPEVNGYYIGQNNIEGDVWRFGSSEFNQMIYKMPTQSTRLMFDTALTILSKRQYSLYGIGGIGNAWNRVSYRDADRSGVPCVDQELHLNSSRHSNFAWEAGAGLSYAFNQHIALSLEYLYADLGKVNSSSEGTMGTITTPVLVPAHFNITAQSALLGLHIIV